MDSLRRTATLPRQPVAEPKASGGQAGIRSAPPGAGRVRLGHEVVRPPALRTAVPVPATAAQDADAGISIAAPQAWTKKRLKGVISWLYEQGENKSSRPGNVHCGCGTAAQVNRLGTTWVGKDAVPAPDPYPPGSLQSLDGRRIFRPPSQKTFRPGLTSTARQANFHFVRDGVDVMNAHFDVVD